MSVRRRSICVLSALACACLAVLSARAESATPERQSELLKSAIDAFDQAVAVTREDAKKAESLYRQSASGFEALADAGVRSAPLEYNLGNTYFRLNDLGKAILHYRRATRLEPAHGDVAANLDYVRRRVEPQFSESAGQVLGERLMFWSRNVSAEWRFRIAATGSIIGWVFLLAWLRWRSRPLAALGVAAVLIGLANTASVMWQLHDENQRPPAVLLTGNQILRQGRGDAYEPVLKQPLGSGVEVRILETRGDWVQVRLPDGTSGWLPAAGIERV